MGGVGLPGPTAVIAADLAMSTIRPQRRVQERVDPSERRPGPRRRLA